MALRLADFQIDIWFLYGSFAYGVESVLFSFSSDSVHVNVLNTDTEAQAETFAFLDDLTENPKGLLRTELRIYGPEDLASLRQVPFPVTLYTERVPTTFEAGAGILQLRFDELRALTVADHSHFDHLVEQVWSKVQP